MECLSPVERIAVVIVQKRMKLLLIFVLIPFLGVCQLPNPELIQKHQISSVEVWHHKLPPILPDHLDVSRWDKNKLHPDTTPEHIATYFFGPEARIDSVYYWYDNHRTTAHYTYDKKSRVVGYQIRKKDKIISTEKVSLLKNGNWEYKRWSEDVLQDHHIARNDSVILQTLPNDRPQNHYFQYSYQPELNQVEFNMMDAKKGTVISARCERWTYKENGSIDSVFMHFEQTKKNARNNNIGLNLDQTYVMNDQNELVPQSTMNIPGPVYYRGLKRTNLIRKYESFQLDQEEILNSTEPYETLTYEWINPRGYYSFVYHYTGENL